MSRAIYAFSGDPITYGHLDIIERATKVFDEVIAAIGINPTKKYLFSTEERVQMVLDSVQHLPNVSVTAYQGLLSDFAYENDVTVIIRGLRNSEDFNFELMLHQINEGQTTGLETLLMPCRQSLAHVSSGAVKALQLEQGQIQDFVPLNVKQKLEERISGQLIIGVTGEIASGKSHLVKELTTLAQAEGISVHPIDLDQLAHEILKTSTEPIYKQFRSKLVAQFGNDIAEADGFIDTDKLGTVIFSNPDKLRQFNQMIYQPLLLRLRKATYHKRGLILLESALLVESNSLHYCNNHVILTQVSASEQQERLEQRGYNQQKIACRLNAQFSYGQKLAAIKAHIARDRFGVIMDANNEGLNKLLNKIMRILPVGNAKATS